MSKTESSGITTVILSRVFLSHVCIFYVVHFIAFMYLFFIIQVHNPFRTLKLHIYCLKIYQTYFTMPVVIPVIYF